MVPHASPITPGQSPIEDEWKHEGIGSFSLPLSESRDLTTFPGSGNSFSSLVWVSWLLTLRCFAWTNAFDIAFDKSKNFCYIDAIDSTQQTTSSPPFYVAATDSVESILELLELRNTCSELPRTNTLPIVGSPSNKPLHCTSLGYGQNSSNPRLLKMLEGDIHVAIVQQGAADARAIVYYKESSVPSKLSKSMLHSFCHIFASIQENPSQIVESIDYCSTYDQKLMTQFTRAMSKRQDACIHDMALRFSSITPNATAVCSWDGDLTYKDLDRMTSQLAHYLIQKGVGPEVFVLSCFEKSKWPIVARLAISRAGGAYVSIDASDPPVYLGSIIQRTQAQVLLTTGKFVDQFRGLVPTLIELSTDMVQNLPTHETPPKTEVHSHNACLILFTSGSTGEPKGIVQEHGSYATAIRDYANALGLTSSTRMLQYDHYASDISNNDYLVALSVGGCCCVPFPKTRVLEYQEEITRMKVNITFLTPTDAVQFDPEAVQCLETICLGGEALPQDLVRKWHGKVKMVNQYGMSELATCCILNDTVHPDKEVNLGRPRTGAVWVVSLANPEQLMPVGAVGELIMEGPHLSRGYIDTVCPKSASFLRQIPTWMESVQPFRKPERMYLSGDLGKYNHDGTITYMGRKDTILKVNGERIDAAEVEYCARKCLSSGDMIVVGILGPFHKSDGPQLVAYIYLKGNSSDQTRQSNEEVTFLSQFENDEFNKIAEAVKSVLYSSLPSYMVPTLFIQVSRIPRTRSNKTDSRKLDQLSQSRFRKVRISKL